MLAPLRVLGLGVAALVATGTVAAQPRLTSVRGIAWDSLHAEPLAGAMISVSGTDRTAAADARGRFQVDSVPFGSHTFMMSHDAVDAVGLTAISVTFDISEGRNDLHLAIPSFAAFWKGGCAGNPPKDSSLVYGVVRHPGTGEPIRAAKVELAWLETSAKNRREVQQRVNRLETTSDARGNFGFCGVPNGAGFRVRASSDSGTSGIIDTDPSPDRVRWRDLTMGFVGQASGTVAGAVARGTGLPFPDARVSIEEVGETRTDSAGRFVFPRVPPGTRQLQVLAVGLDPVSRTFDVAPGDTAKVNVNLDRVTTLNSVRVSATPFTARLISHIAERRSQGLGTFVDSNAIRGVPLMRSALSTIASVKLRPQAGSGMSIARQREPVIEMRNGCRPTVFINGVDQRGQETLWSIPPEDVALFEIYPSQAFIPFDFQGATKAGCVLVVWTKWALRQ